MVLIINYEQVFRTVRNVNLIHSIFSAKWWNNYLLPKQLTNCRATPALLWLMATPWVLRCSLISSTGFPLICTNFFVFLIFCHDVFLLFWNICHAFLFVWNMCCSLANGLPLLRCLSLISNTGFLLIRTISRSSSLHLRLTWFIYLPQQAAYQQPHEKTRSRP